MRPQTTGVPAGTVVVGVDGSPGATAAVKWAAIEAADRGTPLRLVFVHDPAAEGGEAVARRRGINAATSALDRAARVAHASHDGVDVMTVAVCGPPAASLVGSADRPAMICLGSHGAQPARLGHRTGTASEVLLAARCPVAVVRPFMPPHAWIVAQVEFGPSLPAVMRLAFGEAQLRGCPLRLLVDWSTAQGTNSDARDDLESRLRQEIGRLQRQHPNVRVSTSASSDVENFLLENAGDISLFVAPPRRTHDIGTIVHPSAEAAVRLLRCPVIFSVP